MTSMRLTILPVGQGTGTLIEVLDDTGNTIEAMVCDFGGYGWYAPQTSKYSEGLVKQQLESMTTPMLSAVFLSHGDMDHINLMADVLDAFAKPSDPPSSKKKLIVQNVWHGDEWKYYTKYGNNALAKLWEYRPSGTTTNIHDLDWPAFSVAKPLYKSPEGVDVFLVTGNTVPSEVPEVEMHEATQTDNSVRNTPSLVLAIGFGNPYQLIVLTGDATALTMALCRKYLAHFKISIQSVLHITLPHHGSPRTGYALVDAESRKDDTLAETNVKEFVKAFKPQSVSASSGEKYNRLPDARLVDDFCAFAPNIAWPDPALGSSGQHFYTAWFNSGACTIADTTGSGMDEDWPTSDGYHSARTTKAFYSTEYLRRPVANAGVPLAFPYAADREAGPAASTYAANKAIPWATGWAFMVPASGGNPSLKRVDEVTNDAQFAALQALHGDLPRQRFVFLDPADLSKTPEPELEAPAPEPVEVPMPGPRRRSSRVRPLS
jgi:hypothetical protein